MEDNEFLQFLATLPENLKQNYRYNMYRYWELSGKPIDFKQAVHDNLFTLGNDGKYHARTVIRNPRTGDYEFMKAYNHPTINMETNWYYGTDPDQTENEKKEAKWFRDHYTYIPKMPNSEYGMYIDRMKWDPKLKAFRGPVLDEIMIKPSK